MGALVDILVRRRPPAGPAGYLHSAADYDQGGRMSYGTPAPQRGVQVHRNVRKSNRIAAQYDRPVVGDLQFPYHNVQPVVRKRARLMDLHGGLQGHSRPHRYDTN